MTTSLGNKDPFEEFINDMSNLDRAFCSRCGSLCKIGPKPGEDARLLKRATKKEAKTGLCTNCAATAFLMTVEPIMYGLDKNGVKTLLDSRVQKQISAIMKSGKADADFSEINWQLVVDNWELPFAKPKKKRK